MSNEILIIASKFPQPGVAKTRLAKEVGSQIATDIAQAMLVDLVTVHRFQQYDLVIETDDPRSPEKFINLLGDIEVRAGMNSFLRGPSSTTFDVFSHHFEKYNKVVMITSDTPGINGNIINNSLNELNTHDVVIGPDYDGGYYLIGMRRPVNLFSLLPESRTPYLLPTVDLSIKQHLTQVIGLPLRDIDHIENIRQVNWDLLSIKWYRTHSLVKRFLR